MSGACVNIPQPQAPYSASWKQQGGPLRSSPSLTDASKAAVRHMASSLAVEWATKNIRVNVISPGYMAVRLPPTTSLVLELTRSRTDCPHSRNSGP